MSAQIVHQEAIATRVQFNSVDLSAEFMEVVVSDDHLTESGLIATTGSLKLSEVGAIAQSLDDWDGNPLLRIGTTITLDVDYGDGWERHPRGFLIVQGTKFTEENDADGRSAYSNEIEVGCLIAARNFEDDVRSELELPTGGTIHSHVELLFQLAGCGPVVWGPGTTADFAFIDRPKLDGTYIEAAGKMLASIGCFAWCDGFGNTRIDTESGDPIWSLTRGELSDYERVLVGKPPRAIARASASYRVSKNLPTGGPVTSDPQISYGDISLIVPQASGWGPITEVTSSEFVDEASWRIIKTRQEKRLGFNVFGGRQGTPRATTVIALQQTITKQYEPPELGGKLLSIKEDNLQPLAAALKGYADWAIAEKKPISLTTDVTSQSTTLYSYDERDRTREIYKVTSEPIGAVLSSLNPDWAVVYDRWGQPSQAQVSEHDLQQWTEKRPDTWEFNHTIRFAAAREGDGNNGIQTRITQAKGPTEIANIYSQAVAPSSVKIIPKDSGSGQVDPPEPERWPSAAGSSESRQIQEDVPFSGFATNWAPQIQTYSMPYFPDVPEGQEPQRQWLRFYAERWHTVAIRRWKSVRIELPLSSASSDYRPYAAIDLKDTRADYRLLLNGTSWKLTPTEAALSSDCSLLARSQTIGSEVRLFPLFAPNTDAHFGIAFGVTIALPEFYPLFEFEAPWGIELGLAVVEVTVASWGVELGLTAIDADSTETRWGMQLGLTAVFPDRLTADWGVQLGLTAIYPEFLTVGWGVQLGLTVRDRHPLVNDLIDRIAADGSSALSSTETAALSNFLWALDSNGTLSKYHAIYTFPGAIAATQKYNLLDPRDLDGAYRLTFSGGLTHSSSGISPNGTSGYADTHLAPSSVGTQNSGRLAYYSQENIDTGAMMGVGNGYDSGFILVPKFGSGYARFDAINGDQGTEYSAPSRTDGLLSVNRSSSTTVESRRNGANYGTKSDTSTTRNTNSIYLFSRNGLSQYTSNDCGFAAISAGLTEAEEAADYAAVQALMVALGRNV